MLGAVAPSSDFLVCSGPFVHLSVQSFFFLCLECLLVCQWWRDRREASRKCFFSEYLGDAAQTAIALGCSLARYGGPLFS